MILYHHRYTVSGTGPFPIDMLRYDRSHPTTEIGSHLIERTFNGRLGERVYIVVERNTEKAWTPTAARWESFGWRVEPITEGPSRIY